MRERNLSEQLERWADEMEERDITLNALSWVLMSELHLKAGALRVCSIGWWVREGGGGDRTVAEAICMERMAHAFVS